MYPYWDPHLKVPQNLFSVQRLASPPNDPCPVWLSLCCNTKYYENVYLLHRSKHKKPIYCHNLTKNNSGVDTTLDIIFVWKLDWFMRNNIWQHQEFINLNQIPAHCGPGYHAYSAKIADPYVRLWYSLHANRRDTGWVHGGDREHFFSSFIKLPQRSYNYTS